MPFLQTAAATSPSVVRALETVKSLLIPCEIAVVSVLRGQTFTVASTTEITVTQSHVIDIGIISLAEETELPIGSDKNKRIR